MKESAVPDGPLSAGATMAFTQEDIRVMLRETKAADWRKLWIGKDGDNSAVEGNAKSRLLTVRGRVGPHKVL
jgi:hypothetical protein